MRALHAAQQFKFHVYQMIQMENLCIPFKTDLYQIHQTFSSIAILLTFREFFVHPIIQLARQPRNHSHIRWIQYFITSILFSHWNSIPLIRAKVRMINKFK